MRKPILTTLLFAACYTPQPTPAVVARMVQASDKRRLTACVVTINWSEEDLKERCGAPDQVVAWAGHEGERCLLYRTSARSFAMGTGVEVVAACLHTTKLGNNPPVIRVAEVFGLDSTILPQ